ncbi:hypothetical protein CR513_27331, partial [Mucuna pruriens]
MDRFHPHNLDAEFHYDKDIKIQINEYNIYFPDEFVSKLLIEKLPKLWTDYKQQLKQKHKNERAAAKAETLTSKTNMVQDELLQNKYEKKFSYKTKSKNNNSFPVLPSQTFKKKDNCSVRGKLGYHAPQCRY